MDGWSLLCGVILGAFAVVPFAVVVVSLVRVTPKPEPTPDDVPTDYKRGYANGYIMAMRYPPETADEAGIRMAEELRLKEQADEARA